MKFRSVCDCVCHYQDAVFHTVACCEPDRIGFEADVTKDADFRKKYERDLEADADALFALNEAWSVLDADGRSE